MCICRCLVVLKQLTMNFFYTEHLLLPGHADVADMVSQVAVTGEALLYCPLRFLTAALSPDRQGTPAG